MMNYKILLSTLLASLLLTGTLSAKQDSNHIQTDLQQSKENSSNDKLTKEDRSLAKQWMLEEDDWIKFKEIMSGPRGTWSPGLDPLTALGVSETDPIKRRKYAEIWIKMEVRRTELELEFERERMAASMRLFPTAIAIDNRQWIKDYNAKRFTRVKRLLFFTGTNCIDECKDLFRQVRGSVDNRTRLDIYLTNTTSKQEISQWAKKMGISQEEVKNKIITLNLDDGVSKNAGIDIKHLPKVLMMRQDGSINPYK